MEHSGADAVGRLVLELSLILFAAKLGGELTERLLRRPAVLGELAAGLVIGPYALGGLPLPYVGAVFALPTAEAGHSLIPVSPELYALGQLASVILLFVAGLETDFRQFVRFGPAASSSRSPLAPSPPSGSGSPTRRSLLRPSSWAPS